MTCFSKTAALLCGLGAAVWSPASHACTSDPIMSSICVMTVSPAGRFDTFNNGTYVLASGQTLAINTNTALSSLICITFGGNGATTFNLPDLHGKVIVGYDARDGTRAVGAAAGSTTVNLSVAQSPPHVATISNLPVSLGGVAATTTLSGLTATANLGGMVIAGPATGLTMRVLSGSNGQGTPANNYLGKALGASTNIYAAGTPNATLNVGAIGGTLSMTVNANTNAPVTGSATTTLAGDGLANGSSALIGAGAAVPIMPPFRDGAMDRPAARCAGLARQVRKSDIAELYANKKVQKWQFAGPDPTSLDQSSNDTTFCLLRSTIWRVTSGRE